MTTPTRNTFDIGDRPVASCAFTNVAGVPTAPTAVTVKVKAPNGTITTYTSPHATIVLATTCTFTFPSGALNAAGTWTVNFTGTAGVEAADESSFQVRASVFP